MPVKWVLYWQPNEGSTPDYDQILNEILHCLVSLDGVIEDFQKTSTITYFKPILQDETNQEENPYDLVSVRLGDTYYFVNKTQKIVVEADSAEKMIADQLESYGPWRSMYIEGSPHVVGPFRLILAGGQQTDPEKIGVVLEVEYHQTSSMENAIEAMEEFMRRWTIVVAGTSLPGQFKKVEVEFEEFGLGDTYTPEHSALQYAFLILP